MSKFTVESWTWYSVTMIMVLARYTSRIWHFRSIRKLMFEDWFMVFITGLYTVLIAFLNVDHDVSTNLIDPAVPIILTPQEISRRTWGSKTVLLVEQSMCGVQWFCKICMLILYWRLTQNLRQNLAVKLVAAYVITTYCVMFILYFGVWCRPFHDYWQVPTNNVQCTTALNHLITNLVFNLSSDIMIMAIPLPLLLRQKLEWRKKLLMVFPFSLGFFTMVCAILSKYSSFRDPYSVEWVYWYCREASTIMIVSNMPYAWGLLRKVFHLRSFLHDSSNPETGHDRSVQHLEGRSIPQTSIAQSSQQQPSRKRSWPWPRARARARAKAAGNMFSSQHEMVSRTRTNADDATSLNREENKDPNNPSSSDNSTAESVQKPAKSPSPSDAHIIDRIYNLDDIDGEPTRRESHAMQRGYNG